MKVIKKKILEYVLNSLCKAITDDCTTCAMVSANMSCPSATDGSCGDKLKKYLIKEAKEAKTIKDCKTCINFDYSPAYDIDGVCTVKEDRGQPCEVDIYETEDTAGKCEDYEAKESNDG